MKQRQSLNKGTGSEIDWNIVENYLKSQDIVQNDVPLKVTPFSAGYSNLTYCVQIGDWKAVLRRPPYGPIQEKAHDMKREYEILLKLNPVFTLAPKPYLYCDDEEVMDRPFYIMELKEGIVLDDSLPFQYESNPYAGKLISNAMVETLSKLHEINYADVGLETFGYPDGYLTRQVHGWIKRYKNSKTEEIEGVETLEKWLVSNIPISPQPTIIHNDFKLNNMMFSKKEPFKVIGLFDWELSTIGDPLTDVGSMIAYWEEEGEPFSGLSSVTKKTGFCSRKDMLDMYAKKSGIDVSQFDFYLTFAFYKTAVILQQIYYRWKIGEAKDMRFAKLGEGISNLMKQAQRARRKEILI